MSEPLERTKKRWRVKPVISQQSEQALQQYSPILRQILYNRGYEDLDSAQRFIQATPPPGTAPSNLLGVDPAVERIQFAILRSEPIAVYGDYDVDGVTSTALLTLVLESLGADVRGYIPNRFEEGYGLNKNALASLHSNGVRLVITVDCGIRSPDEVEYAQSLGMDVIISDHHRPGPQIPSAQAVINPKQSTDTYPEKNLAGVGLAYKLASALLEASSQEISNSSIEIPSAETYLDLVALGTVADVSPMIGENRSLVRTGLEYINNAFRVGLRSLIGVSRLSTSQITSGHIGFVLGPRLNAAGRLDSALAALELLTTSDISQAARLAQQLDDQNKKRQEITRRIQVHAEKVALKEDPEGMLLFAAHPEYNPGVVGLAASRLTDQYYRPAIVAHKGEEFTRASCRSIPEFNITEALDQTEDILVRHGGHAAAAGFTVRNEDLPELVQRLKVIAHEKLDSLELQSVLDVDAEIELKQLKPSLLEDLTKLQPTGNENPQASFVTRNLKVRRSRGVGKDNAHLKLFVTDGRMSIDAIAFRLGHWQSQMPELIDLLYRFELNEYNGRTSLQLNVLDLKPADTMD